MTSTKIMESFQGSFVYVLTRTLRSSQERKSGPLIIEGFLLDSDEEYFFLGMTMDEVTEAVKRDEVVRIFLPIDELSSLLEQHGSGELN